jgi:hypothetical protein
MSAPQAHVLFDKSSAGRQASFLWTPPQSLTLCRAALPHRPVVAVCLVLSEAATRSRHLRLRDGLTVTPELHDVAAAIADLMGSPMQLYDEGAHPCLFRALPLTGGLERSQPLSTMASTGTDRPHGFSSPESAGGANLGASRCLGADPSPKSVAPLRRDLAPNHEPQGAPCEAEPPCSQSAATDPWMVTDLGTTRGREAAHTPRPVGAGLSAGCLGPAQRQPHSLRSGVGLRP